MIQGLSIYCNPLPLPYTVQTLIMLITAEVI